MTGRRALTAPLVALLAVVASACGVPTDDQPRTASPDAVPFRLLDPEAGVPTTTTTTTPVQTERIEIHLLRDDLLVPITRVLTDPVPLARVVEALVDGPTEDEIADGLRSGILGDGFLLDVTVEGGVAAVDLGEDFAEASTTDQLLAIAQIVFTLTGRPGIGRATFRLDDERVEVPRGDGSLTDGSVSRDDYESLLASPDADTTTTSTSEA
jgi:hypothetical protein